MNGALLRYHYDAEYHAWVNLCWYICRNWHKALVPVTEQPNRWADEHTTSLDLRDWHFNDKPRCYNTSNWIVGPPGYHCTVCDWWCSV